MGHVGGRSAQVGGELTDFAGVGFRLHGPVERLLEPGCRDQLHGPRDLADVANRLAAFHDGPCLCHDYTRSPVAGLNCAWKPWIAATNCCSISFVNLRSFSKVVRTSDFCSRMYRRNCSSHAATCLIGTLSR